MKILTVLLLILGSFLFYWFQIRPSNIRNECVKNAEIRAVKITKLRLELEPGELDEYDKNIIQNKLFKEDDYKDFYQVCLNEKGLK